jgi:hypothetical protein
MLLAAGLVSVAAALPPGSGPAPTDAPTLTVLPTGETVVQGWSRNAERVRETMFAVSPAEGDASSPVRLIAGAASGGRGAAAIELLHGQLWTRLAEGADDAITHAPASSREFQNWMLTDDPDSQLRAYFPLLTYPLFLTRRVAGGAAGTELLTVVRDHTKDHCTVWIAYPGPADGDATKDADVAFHPWDHRWEKPGFALQRVGLPVGRYVRLDLRRRDPGRGRPAVWFVEATPRPAGLDELDATADAPLIGALKSAVRGARRATAAMEAAAPAGRGTFRGFRLGDA